MSEDFKDHAKLSACDGGNGAEAGACGLTKKPSLYVRRASMDDIASIVALALESAQEQGALHTFKKDHAQAHMEDLLRRGIIYAAFMGDELIGAVMLAPIDTGFSFLPDLESHHLFLRADRRGYHVVNALKNRVQDHADEHGINVLFHQVAYFAALSGDKTHTQRVEKLYKRFKFDGSYGITYVCRPRRQREH